jgi:hypothetical protein
MAHSALHFTAGFVVGSLVAARPVLAAWRKGPLARPLGRWLLTAYGLGLFATVPSLLHWMGVPLSVCRAWWMNLFLFHPLLTALRPGGMIAAAPALLLCFLLPYGAILLALFRRSNTAAPDGD